MPRSRRWIPILVVLLVPLVTTVDVTSLRASALTATAALTGRTGTAAQNGDVQEADRQQNPQRSSGIHIARVVQVALLDIKMTVSAMKQLLGIMSGPSVTGP